jgi:hypothetical protein
MAQPRRKTMTDYEVEISFEKKREELMTLRHALENEIKRQIRRPATWGGVADIGRLNQCLREALGIED